MKKTIVGGILAALATVILCVCLTACSNADVTGTYKFYSMKGSYGGVSVDVKVGDDFMGLMTLTEDFMVVTLNEDGTCSMSAMGTETKGEWKKDGSKYILTVAGEDQEVKISGGKLTMSQDGAEVVLKKS